MKAMYLHSRMWFSKQRLSKLLLPVSLTVSINNLFSLFTKNIQYRIKF